MLRDQKSIMVDTETHEMVSTFARQAGLSQGSVVKSLCNMVLNRVNYAKKENIIPREPPIVTNPASERYGEPWQDSSDYRLYVALYLRDIGFLSGDEFDKYRDNLEMYLFIHGIEFISKVEF